VAAFKAQQQQQAAQREALQAQQLLLVPPGLPLLASSLSSGSIWVGGGLGPSGRLGVEPLAPALLMPVAAAAPKPVPRGGRCAGSWVLQQRQLGGWGRGVVACRVAAVMRMGLAGCGDAVVVGMVDTMTAGHFPRTARRRTAKPLIVAASYGSGPLDSSESDDSGCE
jgi:hypothetical protein